MNRRLEDIRPSNRRSIHDIPAHKSPAHVDVKAIHHSPQPVNVAEERRHDHKQEHSQQNRPDHNHQQTHTHKRKRSGLKWLLLIIGLIVVVAGLGYIASVYFARASFTVTPKVASVDVNSTYLAQDSAQGLAIASGTIPFSFITVRESASTTVSASAGPAVLAKAQGPVTIYNAFNNQPQRLVAGTRVVNSSGKVYRLSGSVVVPGYTVSSSKSVIPGSIDTTIIADQPGDTYNITTNSSISDFKMIAYKGTTKYDTIYARLTGPVAGGMIGVKSIVSSDVIGSSTDALKSKIFSDLKKQIQLTIPNGYILYNTGFISSFASSTVISIDKDHSSMILQGSVSGMIFKKSDLISRLAGQAAISTFGSFKYDVTGLDQLAVSVMSTASPTSSKQVSKPIISIKIKGTIKLTAFVPIDEIIKKILGKNSVQVESIFGQYSQVIENVDGEVMPPWSKVPMNTNRISIKLK